METIMNFTMTTILFGTAASLFSWGVLYPVLS